MHTEAGSGRSTEGCALFDVAAQAPSLSPESARAKARTSDIAAKTTLYFPTLDGLRFIAFLLVFIHHLPRSTNPALRIVSDHGWVGVHLFLFLSAYLLTSILRSEHLSTGRISVFSFYVRRSLRIWPLYFIFCFGMLAYQLLLHPERGIDWTGFAGLMFFVDNILSGVRGYNQIPFAGHLWTISLEEQFYAVLPFVAAGLLASPRRFRTCLIGCWLAFLAIRALAVHIEATHPLIWTSVFSADALLLGTLLAVTSLSFPTSMSGRVLLVGGGISALFSAALMPPIQVPGVHQVFVYSLIAVGTAALTIAALHEPALQFLKTAPLRYLGKISYGLYVFHLVGIAIGSKLIQAAGLGPGEATWWITAGTAFLATAVLSVLSYELLEKRFLMMKESFEVIRSRPV